jgi:hypothetical protein
MKLIKACFALAAFAAIFVIPSLASATSPALTETTATGENHILATGNKIIGTNVEHSGTAVTTILKSNLGNIECLSATVTGTLTRNEGGVIEGEAETAEVRGRHTEPSSIHCKGGFGGNTTVTPSHSSGLGIPWCVKSTPEDKFEVKGGVCGGQVNLKFALHTATLKTCVYERAPAVIGTYTTHPADAILTISGGENASFTKVSGSIFCPNKGELFMAFTLSTDNNGNGGAAVNIK